MAVVNLGKIRFNWTGAYNGATAYVADDVASSGGNSYVCILASTGNAVSNGTYWSLMAQAGTDGTDVGLGTAGQVLQTNSGASATEWATPAAGGAWNLISTTTISSSPSTVTVVGLDGGHANYALMFNSIDLNSSGISLYFKFGTGATPTISSTKYHGSYNKISSGTTSFASARYQNQTYATLGVALVNGANDALDGMMMIHSPSGTTNNKAWTSHCLGWNSSGDVINYIGGGSWELTTAITAVQLSLSSGTFDAGTIKLYGIS
tara:strand:- start:344 stop:1135 length:792 start_codon:yes stop_codon:yes gene_type:complete